MRGVLSINQSNFYSANIPSEATLNRATAMLGVQMQNRWSSSITSMGHQACWCLRGKGQVKEMSPGVSCHWAGLCWGYWDYRNLIDWLKVATEMAKQTDRREVVPKRWSTRVQSYCTCVGLDPRDRQTNSFVWSKWTGWEWWGKHGVKINRLLFMKHFESQQTDLEQYSKFYRQPMKGIKQWNTASKWRWFRHDAGQSILNMLKFSEVSVRDTIQKWIAIIKMTRHKISWK